MEWISLGYFGLFITTFLSATLIPFASELVVISFLIYGFQPFWVFLIAGLGNSLGSILNFEIGHLGKTVWLEKIRVPTTTIYRWENHIKRFGHWLGLVVWLPIIGDILAIALGFFKAKRIPSYLLMSLGKFIRYGIIVLGFYCFS